MTQHPASPVLYGEPPEGGSASLLETADGITLRFAHWPAKGEARGAILLAQGRTEYIEKAYEWIAKFQERGLHVGAFDFRGQGLSQRMLPNRRKGYVQSFGEFQHDYDAAFDAFRNVIADHPLLVCGHSMGGLATTRFLSRRQGELDGAIMTAPMLGLALPFPVSFLVRMMTKAATALGFGDRYVQGCDDRSGADRGFEDNVLTHDQARFERHAQMLDAHPDLVLGGTTHAWLRAGYKEMAEVAALPAGWLEKKILLFSASDDTVVSNAAIDAMVASNPLAKNIHLIGSKHEPLMELEAVQTALWTAIDGYLDRTLTSQG